VSDLFFGIAGKALQVDLHQMWVLSELLRFLLIREAVLSDNKRLTPCHFDIVDGFNPRSRDSLIGQRR
jgi:hypothetical protein